MDSPFRDLSYGVMFFSVAKIIIDFDKLIFWYHIPRYILKIVSETRSRIEMFDQNQNQNQNSDQI